MLHTIFLQDYINQLVAEMSTAICDQCSRGAEPCENVVAKELDTTLVSLVRVGIASTHLET